MTGGGVVPHHVKGLVGVEPGVDRGHLAGRIQRVQVAGREGGHLGR